MSKHMSERVSMRMSNYWYDITPSPHSLYGAAMCFPLALRDVHFLAADSLKWRLFEDAVLRGDLSFYDFQSSSLGYFFEVDIGEE